MYYACILVFGVFVETVIVRVSFIHCHIILKRGKFSFMIVFHFFISQEGALYEYSVYAEENEICPLNSAITIPGMDREVTRKHKFN